MRAILIPASLAVALLASVAATPAEAAGCLKGAAIGAVAGHFLGGHGLLGAGAGCVVGRTNSNRQDERNRAYEPGDTYQPNGVNNYQRPQPYSGGGDPRDYRYDPNNVYRR